MRLILVRHAESRSNADPTAVALPEREGDRLTPRGWRQAERLAASLRGLEVAEMLTSPMRRARETASAIETALGVTAEVNDLIHELRESEGFGDLSPEEQKLRRWSEWMVANGEDPDYSHDGAESFNQVVGRVRRFQEQLAAGDGSRLVLAVTHGIFSRFFLAESLLGDGFGAADVARLWQLRTVNCGVSVFEHGESRHPADPEMRGWVCSTWMARPWLTGPASLSQPSGLK
jgi:uncharacterized phosphatase